MSNEVIITKEHMKLVLPIINGAAQDLAALIEEDGEISDYKNRYHNLNMLREAAHMLSTTIATPTPFFIICTDKLPTLPPG